MCRPGTVSWQRIANCVHGLRDPVIKGQAYGKFRSHAALIHRRYFNKVCLQMVKLLMHVLEVRVGDMCINLCGGDITVTEHGLHTAQICAIHQ